MIPVTRPFLPPIGEYKDYLDKIWQSQWLTNMGPLANELEEKLRLYLNIPHLLFVTNGTIALQMAIKALDLKGEIITTPFSFVATTSSIAWEGCTPVFVDIEEQSLNIDPAKIEAAITNNTSAILATHVYGNPCDVETIQKIADNHGLKVIYDGAHAFGVQVNGKSIFEYGHISICSLHATKLYHSGEGGLLMTADGKLHQKLKYIRNFGISGLESFAELGINGKNSEFHAAMGLTNMLHIPAIHEKRQQLTKLYLNLLGGVVVFPQWHPAATKNYAYFPVLFSSEKELLDVVDALKKEDIQTRRYFYPSLAAALPYLKPETGHSRRMPITDNTAKRVLCLPLYFDLRKAEVERICEVILKEIGMK